MPSLHHLTWVVRDLDATLASLEPLLPARDFLREVLPQRGVATARVRLGEAWLVFVQPLGPGIPADRLANCGEGPLLLSLRVSSLDRALEAFATRDMQAAGARRTGVGGWNVIDVDLRLPGGTMLQLCEDERSATPG